MQMYSEILKSRLFFILVLIMSAGLIRPVFASEEPSITTVRIDEIRFEVSGKTRPEALAREIKLETGSEYSTIDEFQTHLNREVQDLINLRVFSDVTADVIIVSEGISSDGRGWENVLIVFKVEDTWTLFPFLVPSSDGSTTVFTMAVVDKNFLGTLTEFSISGDFGIGTDPITGSLEIPRWGFYFKWSGFTVNQWQFNTVLSQSFQTMRKFNDSILVEDYSFFETLYLFNVRYEFKRVPYLYTLITPMLSWRYGYNIRRQFEEIEYEYFRTGLSLGLDYNRIDWKDFYRQGWALGIFDATWGSWGEDRSQLKTIVKTRFSGYGITGKVNPSTRVVGMMSFNHEMTGLGSYLRGVPDDGAYGDRAVFLNTGIQIRLWKGVWAEPHLLPFVDAGLVAKRDEPLNFKDDFFLGVGSELILFLPTLPSAQIRGWIGFDMSVDEWSRAKWEVGASFQLHY